MPEKHERTLRQLGEQAVRYARFYFDPAERARWRATVDTSGDASYAVLLVNRFVPADSMTATASMLRRFVRGTHLYEPETQLLQAYWGALDASKKQLHTSLVAGDPTLAVQATASALPTWPAVGLARSEDEMRSLLVLQFERIRQNRIPWRGADSHTYPIDTRGGIYVLVDWFWHGL